MSLVPPQQTEPPNVGVLIDDSPAMTRTRNAMAGLMTMMLPIVAEQQGLDIWFANHQSTAAASDGKPGGGYYFVFYKERLDDIIHAVEPGATADLRAALERILTPFHSANHPTPLHLFVMVNKPDDRLDDILNLISDVSNRLDTLKAPADVLKIVFVQADVTDPSVTTFLSELSRRDETTRKLVTAITADTIEKHEHGVLEAVTHSLGTALNPTTD
jgi:hypothetical protein